VAGKDMMAMRTIANTAVRCYNRLEFNLAEPFVVDLGVYTTVFKSA